MASPARAPRWYGWQTALADGAMISMMTAGVGRNVSALAFTGLVGYAIAPPLVHLAHGRPRAMGVDFGLRLLVAPAATTLLGFGIGTLACRRQACSGVGAAVGLLSAWPVAATIDATVLANDDGVAAPDSPPPAESPALGVTLVPTMEQGRLRGATVGATARF